MKDIRRQKAFSHSTARNSRKPARERHLLERIATLESSLQQQQEQQQERLAEAIRRFYELNELAPVCFLTLDRRCRIVSLNQNSARLLGFPHEWLHMRPFLVFVAQGDTLGFLELLRRVRIGREHQETMALELSINDRTVPVQIWIRTSSKDNEIIYRTAILDLTETKAIENDLKEALNNWYSLVENAADIIMTIDRRSKVRFVNREAWGRLQSEVTGTLLMDYALEKDRKTLEKCIGQAFESVVPSNCELSGLNGDKDHWYSFSFGPVHLGPRGDQDQTTTVVIRDITVHKRTEQSLRASREQLREFAARLEAVREEERTRVAREIHDELGQMLTILKMDLSWLHRKNGHDQAQSRKKIKSMIGDVDQTIERVRKIVTDLRPSILDELGLTAALDWQVHQFQERTGIRGFFESSSDNLDLSKDVSAALFRVVQEALTNVMRHARAKEVCVRLVSEGGLLRISIADNGKGITRPQINDRKSFGLVGMRERVHRIGGEFNIFSLPGRGTRLDISIPLK